MNFGVDIIYEHNNKWNEDSALLLFFYGSSTYYMMAAGWFLMGYKHEPWDMALATTFSSSDENQILNQLNLKWCSGFMTRHTPQKKTAAMNKQYEPN